MPIRHINGVRLYQSEVIGFTERLVVELHLPGDPLLATFCCEAIAAMKDRERVGDRVPHGRRLNFPCHPTVTAPTSSSSRTFIWEVSKCGCGAGVPCSRVLYEEAAEVGWLNWTSLPHTCAPCDGDYAQATGESPFFPASPGSLTPLTLTQVKSGFQITTRPISFRVSAAGSVDVELLCVVGNIFDHHSNTAVLAIAKDDPANVVATSPPLVLPAFMSLAEGRVAAANISVGTGTNIYVGGWTEGSFPNATAPLSALARILYHPPEP